MVAAGQRGDWYDGRKGVALEPAYQAHALIAGVVAIDEQQAGMTPEHDRFHIVRLAEHQQGERMACRPLADQGRHRTAVRRKEENRRASPHPVPLVRSYVPLTYEPESLKSNQEVGPD